MDELEIVRTISDVGFPIVVALYLLVRVDRLLRAIEKRLVDVLIAIKENGGKS